MSKSMIYTVQTAIVEVSDGGTLPLGATIHRFGQNLKQDGNVISMRNQRNQCGYYIIDVDVDLEAAVSAPVSVKVLKNGVELVGGKATIAPIPAATVVPFSINTATRLDGPGVTGTLSVEVEGADVKVVNMTARVVKV